jgi:signal transduction histidine kinase
MIAASLLIVSALHYGTPRDPAFHSLHDVWRRLYYVPIILGAFHYGLRGGLIAALAATLLYLPHVLFQWGGMAHGNQYLEILMFWVIGLITGLLAGELRRRREEARLAYERLEASFERTKEAERLAAMGQLSAALAHEIRNPLASLEGSLPILLEGMPADDPRQEFAAIVRRELQRLEELTSEFLEYARPPQPSWAEDDLNAVAAGVLQLAGTEAQRVGVAIHTAFDPQLPRIWMDSHRMRQVILNLALNAVEAMPGGGSLRISTHGDDEAVYLTVEDDGPGIPDGIRERIFEPFVTSKERGTGLGLAVVHGWVTRQGGSIEVHSELGSGTRFEMRFPKRVRPPVA